jgi:hypothetical protein
MGGSCSLEPTVADCLAVVHRCRQPLPRTGQVDRAALEPPERAGDPIQARQQRTHTGQRGRALRPAVADHQTHSFAASRAMWRHISLRNESLRNEHPIQVVVPENPSVFAGPARPRFQVIRRQIGRKRNHLGATRSKSERRATQDRTRTRAHPMPRHCLRRRQPRRFVARSMPPQGRETIRRRGQSTRGRGGAFP